jgi:predicted aconitase with swiveling domain
MTTRVYVGGEAAGRALLLARPLSFWGGLDAETGRIIDRTHPQFGAHVSGSILVMPAGRGSSSSSAVLAESIRRGTAPAAIVLAEADPILVVGALVAQALYGKTCPVVVGPIDMIRPGDTVRVTGARLEVQS